MESIWNLLEIIGRKEKLKLLGVTFEQVPGILILIIYLVRLAVGCTC